VEWGKVNWSTKAAISLKRVKMEEKLLWSLEGPYELTNALLNGTIPTPYDLLFPQNKDWGFATPPITPIAIISGIYR